MFLMLPLWNPAWLSSSTPDNHKEKQQKSPRLCNLGDFCFKNYYKYAYITYIFYSTTQLWNKIMEDVVIDGRPEDIQPNLGFRPAPRKSKKNLFNSSTWNYLFNFFSCCLITISLLGMDFILFASSGPFNIFSGTSHLRPEVLYFLIGMALTITLLYFCLSFLSIILYILTALVTGFVTYAFICQFANFNIESTEVFSAVVAGVIVFAILALTPKRIKALLVLTVVFCFGAVLVNQNQDRSEFVINPDMVSAPVGDDSQKLITVMIANAPSYSYLATLDKKDASEIYKEQLMKIMLAFYAKNGFKLYPNAYITSTNQFINAARNLNYTAGEDISFLQNQVLKNGYWQFKNREDFEAYLKDNIVYDGLKEKGYKISAYQSHGINLCKKNNQDAVNRCVTKVNFPVNIDSLQFSTGDKIKILAIQWLESTGWFNNEDIMENLYGSAKTFYNPAKTPILGTTYKKLYVINSYKALDLMLDDIEKDKGNQAYFIYLDLPSDMYVYDDMCRLKGMDEWLVKYNQPWVENKSFLEKRNAYMKQTMCLFGQLEKMMERLGQLPNSQNISVIIEGLAGMDDMIGSNNDDYAERFINGQLTALAVKTAGSKKFVINKSICAVEDILNNQLNNGPKCEEFAHTKLSKSIKKSVTESLASVAFTNTIAQKSLQEFNRWYKEWHKLNYRAPEKSLLVPLGKADLVETAELPSASGLLPLENTNISEQKIMTNEIQVGSEAEVIPLSQVNGAAVAQ